MDFITCLQKIKNVYSDIVFEFGSWLSSKVELYLMNRGFNPVIIKKENRLEYYEALDKAHITGNYTNFVKLITKLEIEMLEKYLELL